VRYVLSKVSRVVTIVTTCDSLRKYQKLTYAKDEK
jgi:hypothetical protein